MMLVFELLSALLSTLEHWVWAMSRIVKTGVDINLSEEQKDMGKETMKLKVGETTASTMDSGEHEAKKSK